MNDFWNNIVRYPRFFVSSLLGLLLVIVSPFKNLFKIPKLRIFIILGLIIVFLLLYLVIINMIAL